MPFGMLQAGWTELSPGGIAVGPSGPIQKDSQGDLAGCVADGFRTRER